MPLPDRKLTVRCLVTCGPNMGQVTEERRNAYSLPLPANWPERNRLWLVECDGTWTLTEEQSGAAVSVLNGAYGKGLRAARNAAAAFLAQHGERVAASIADRAASMLANFASAIAANGGAA